MQTTTSPQAVERTQIIKSIRQLCRDLNIPRICGGIRPAQANQLTDEELQRTLADIQKLQRPISVIPESAAKFVNYPLA